MKRSAMHVTAFFGSPRKNGNTEVLLKEAVRGAEEAGASVETFNLNLMKIKTCQDCGGCNDTGQCVFQDDMNLVYDAIRKADRIILASPIFFFALSAQAKIMIDRCQSFWCEKYLMKKPLKPGKFGRKGLLLLVGGMKNDVGVSCCESCAKAFFRTVSVSEHVTLSYLNIDQKGDILRHPTAVQEAFQSGKRLIEE